jgi:hypothetical protein
MHRAVKKCGSQVLLNSSEKFGISSEFSPKLERGGTDGARSAWFGHGLSAGCFEISNYLMDLDGGDELIAALDPAHPHNLLEVDRCRHVWSLELLFRLVLLSYLSLNANVQVCLLDWATAYWIY